MNTNNDWVSEVRTRLAPNSSRFAGMAKTGTGGLKILCLNSDVVQVDFVDGRWRIACTCGAPDRLVPAHRKVEDLANELFCITIYHGYEQP